MNLGDFPNVLVVSACENCGVETEPNLWRKANYSSEGDYPDKDTRPERFRPWYVHVGAPGLDLFGPVDQYAQATAPGGTSEAAGFAGSVAAAMVNCYPGHFFMKQKNHIHYGLLKERLQLTSTPFPGGEENLSRISAGILDPAVALLDPTKHWVRLNDQRGWDGTDNPYYELKDPKWCAETISVSKIDDQRKRPLSTKNSYRVYRLPKTGGDEKAQWILYRLVTSDNLDHSLSQIRSLGPYFIDKPIPSEPLLTGDLISLKATTRRTLKVEEIADLVLAGRITRRETTCNP